MKSRAAIALEAGKPLELAEIDVPEQPERFAHVLQRHVVSLPSVASGMPIPWITTW